MNKYIFIILLFIFSSCSSVKNADNRDANNSTKSIDELNTVSQGINSLTGVTIEITLWRNLMPMSGQNAESGINANLRISVNDSSYINAFTIQRMWVISGKKIWENKLFKTAGLNNMLIEFTANGGPRWKAGETADVVIEIKSGDSLKLVKQIGLLINAVY